MHRPGHYGATLLCTAPASFVVGEQLGLAFSLLALSVSMLPDVDTRVSFLPHRGPTHTLAFVVGASVALGLPAGIVLAVLQPGLPLGLYIAFCTGAFLVGLVSHLLADTLTPGYGTNALQPFLPVSARVVRVGIARVDSLAWNGGLLIAGLAAHVAIYLA